MDQEPVTGSAKSVREVPRPVGPPLTAERTEGAERTGPGTVEAIFVGPDGGAPMRRVGTVAAIADHGLEGDRYCDRTGYWSGLDDCQVTLIESEALDDIADQYGVDVSEGQHRRNIVTRGLSFSALPGRYLRVGNAVLAYDRPRPPCRYIESITEPGMARALAARRGGICVRVVESGNIGVGDLIQVVAPPPHRMVTLAL